LKDSVRPADGANVNLCALFSGRSSTIQVIRNQWDFGFGGFMALVLGCQAVSKSYSARLLFENISMGISDGERVGLIGPNGAGKSTFLRLLLGIESPDSGTISIRKLARISHVAQDPFFPASKTVGQVLREALTPLP
jgi:ABC-type multidrug transport system fused ATPase/permease subunit